MVLYWSWVWLLLELALHYDIIYSSMQPLIAVMNVLAHLLCHNNYIYHNCIAKLMLSNTVWHKINAMYAYQCCKVAIWNKNSFCEILRIYTWLHIIYKQPQNDAKYYIMYNITINVCDTVHHLCINGLNAYQLFSVTWYILLLCSAFRACWMLLRMHVLPLVTRLKWAAGRTSRLLHDPHTATIHLLLHKLWRI